MQVSSLLQHFGGPTVKVEVGWLQALEGVELGLTRFFRSAEQAHAALAPWMPVWFLPIATVAPATVAGLDLRPVVQRGAAPHVLETNTRGDFAVEALDLRDYAITRYAQEVALLDTLGPRQRAQRDRVLAIFGADALAGFDDLGEDSLPRWRWARGDRSPAVALATSAGRTHAEALAIAQQAIERSPDDLSLRYDAAARANALRDYPAGLAHLRAALECPLYTRHRVALSELDEIVIFYAEIFPELLPPELAKRWGEALRGGRGAQIAEARAAGQLDRALRLAVDDAAELGANRSRLDLIAALGHELGAPALAQLCAFRA